MKQRTSQTARHKAFTLVELLTVIGLIVLLITMLVPSLSNVRKQGRITRTKATISVMGKGLEMFHDSKIGGDAYPPSYWAPADTANTPGDPYFGNVTNTGPYSGAQTLVWALTGADMLGSPGFSDNLSNDPNSPANKAGLYVLDAAQKPIHYRADAFVSPSQLPLQRFGLNQQFATVQDDFGSPILYYRATVPFPRLGNPQDIYNYRDNQQYTGATTPKDPSGHHPISATPNGKTFKTDDGTVITFNNWNNGFSYFSRYIRNTKISAAYVPNNDKSYLLISAGPDGLYGTSDDVVNFNLVQGKGDWDKANAD